MKVVALDVPELGTRAHLVHDGKVGLVVDPPRDVARVEQAAELAGVEIVAVAETHVHNDYLSGGLALARRHGADYLVSADEQVDFPRAQVHDGDVVGVGDLTVTAVWTPGHTPTHLSFLVESTGEAGEAGAVFSGGSLLYGTVGRTDLVAPESTEGLARAQWSSARRLATLAPDAGLYPTHGFGSFCAGSAVRQACEDVTVAGQHAANPALTMSRDDFVTRLLSGFGPVPRYYPHMAPLNRAGAGARPVGELVLASSGEVAAAVARGDWVIDLRPRSEFAESHLAGTVNVEYGPQFATYVGWLAPWAGRHVLLVDDPDELDPPARDLAGIGVEGLRGHVLPCAESLQRPVGYRRTDWSGFLERGAPGVVVDVRQRDEYDEGHLADALHIPIQDIEGRIDEIPSGEVWVHCRSGYRASIAASLLRRAGRDVVHVDDSWDRALELGLDRLPGEADVAGDTLDKGN